MALKWIHWLSTRFSVCQVKANGCHISYYTVTLGDDSEQQTKSWNGYWVHRCTKYIRACQTKKKLLKFCNILELFKNIKCKWICCVCVMYICDDPLFRQIREPYLNSICVNVYIMYCTCRLLTMYIVHTNRSSSICYISVYDDWWGTLTSESYIYYP